MKISVCLNISTLLSAGFSAECFLYFDPYFHFLEGKCSVCVNDRLGISGSLLSATYVSVNRPAELQKGVKFCPISDL